MKNKDQIWDQEVSNWKHRNYEREVFLKEVSLLSGRVLEIGPGHGRVMRKVPDSIDIFGIDLSFTLLKNMKPFKVVQGNSLDMPFKSNSFDAVICEQVIEHIKDQEQLIFEVFRLLKNNGIVIIATPNKWVYRLLMYLSNIKNGVFDWNLIKNPTPGHVAELTAKQLIYKLIPKFELLKFSSLNYYLRDRCKWLAIDHLVVAKKVISS